MPQKHQDFPDSPRENYKGFILNKLHFMKLSGFVAKNIFSEVTHF